MPKQKQKGMAEGQRPQTGEKTTVPPAEKKRIPPNWPIKGGTEAKEPTVKKKTLLGANPAGAQRPKQGGKHQLR